MVSGFPEHFKDRSNRMTPDPTNGQTSPTTPGNDPSSPRRKGMRRVLFPVVVLALLGVVLYGILGRPGKETDAAMACTATRSLAQKLKPLVHGEVAALALASTPEPLPMLNFSGPDAKNLTLADFRGRNVLLNLWATWCVPCRQEMPALDRLEGKLGDDKFEVVTINIDTARLDRPKAFLSEIGVKNLGFYSDSRADVFQVLKQDGKVLGLPTTILVGKDGCEIGTMAGPAQWDSGDGLALIEALKG
jgi:thiol-disulfide isomerase/thioredoxin